MERGQIKILYEDSHLLVCLKPANVLSEGAGMPQLLQEQCGAAQVFCVHRLDREASGLMVYAKTKAAASGLSAQIAAGKMEKQYLAVVEGPTEPQGLMQDLLFKDSARNKSYVVTRMRKGVRQAELRYETLGTDQHLSLVKITLVTGRSHQIRVQFSSRGLPLVGDRKYGSSHRDAPLALWSCALRFTHPAENLPLSFSAPPPENWPWSEFEDCLQ